MYLEYYGLREPPFSITPDPRFVYLSERHRDALAHLLFGIGQGGSGGFVQLTGEVGTGKTTLCRLLLEQLPENTRVALVLNPQVTPLELLEAICQELHIDLRHRVYSRKALVDALNDYLLDAYAKGLRVVLIIDEAQELSRDALEQVRLLTNLETPTQKLLQIILLGQPELREVLASPDLRQLAQRITARYHLMPLDEEETEAYVRHRLAVAGCQRFPFSKLALRKLHQHSGGIPRLINVIAERALLAGYARDLSQINERLVDRAASETLSHPIRRLRPPRLAWVAALTLVAGALTFWYWPRPPEAELTAAVPPPAPALRTVLPPAVTYLDGESFVLRVLGAGEHSHLPAWNRLLALWTLRADQVAVDSAMRCPPQVAPGVFCLRSRGNLTKLAALGRPSILRLGYEGREAWALLLGLDAMRVRLALFGETFDVDRTQLERLWNGEFHTLWRAPDFVALPLRRGETGPAVDWLRDRLLDEPQRALAVGPALFDPDTEAEVRRLQTARGLIPDGIVGLETLLALTADSGSGPELRRSLQ